jgi:hypothetical protein
VGVVRNKVIFCEGGSESLDFQLINNKVLENLSNEITIIPVGGKFNFSLFIQAYFSIDKNKNDENNKKQNNEKNQKATKKYIIFRDRDFDIEPTSENKLLQIDKLGNRAFLSHRTCIENYLLDPELIHQYWITQYAEKLDNPTIFRWGHKDSPGIDKIAQWIEEAAKNLQDYQAVRWALGNLCQLSASRKQLDTSWTKDTIPDSLDLSDCKNQALSLINEFKNTVAEVTIDKFEENLNRYLQLFHQEEFWQQNQYLTWFNGKDIYKVMHKISQDKKRPYKSYISMYDFSKWAINHIDINQYPDLIELQNKIELL